MRDENHPKHRSRWQQHVNELLNRGSFRLVSPTAVLNFQRELALAVIDASRAAVAFDKLAENRLPDDETRLKRRAQMWRDWTKQLRQWIADLNQFT